MQIFLIKADRPTKNLDLVTYDDWNADEAFVFIDGKKT